MMHANDRKFYFPDNGNDATSPKSMNGRDCDRVIINVGGHKHETHVSTLKNFPDTRLSWMVESPLTKAYNTSDHGQPIEFFFDRHPGVFVHILNYYRTGKLHCPADVCGPLFEEELNYWGIDELQMEPCCWSTYTRHRDAKAFEKVFSANAFHHDDDVSEGEHSNIVTECDPCHYPSIYRVTRKKLWEVLEKPYSSKSAQVLALVSLLIIITSVITFCLESMPHLNVYKRTFEILDFVYCAVFTMDFLARVFSCPNLRKFFRSTLTWCDIVSVLPFYINIIWQVDYLNVFLVVRLFRIFRLFRFFRFMSGMQVIGHTLKASARELFLLVLILFIPMVIFSSLLFYTEKLFDGDQRFESIPASFWWAVITMTTVGYGDMYPRTALGQFIGTMCACSGVLIVALPVSVIGSNFSLFYSHAQAQLKLPQKRKQPVLVGAASALISTVEPEHEVSSDSETNSPNEIYCQMNEKSMKNRLSNTTDSTNDIHVELETLETIELKRKLTPDARPPWFHESKLDHEMKKSSHSLEGRCRGVFSRGSPEMGLQKSIKAMGDIMLNIAAPMQRRMAISGVSLSNSPSLRRSNSGKRRSKSKSRDSLRKRAYTSGSDNCRSDGFDENRLYLFAEHNECDVDIETEARKSTSHNTQEKELDGDNLSDSNIRDEYSSVSSPLDESITDFVKFELSLKQENSPASSSEVKPLMETTHAKDTKMKSCNPLQQMEQKRPEENAGIPPQILECQTSPHVIDCNRLSTWYSYGKQSNDVALPKVSGRRRSTTINLCDV